ncbi:MULTISPECIES: LacI family DNA-binding transcriptional regulator [unclassified Yoonia]|uniref:LacI family DNA-binding transcriptional regulator n=1 Tax=unclassified Yoonia TaxID=2629118 RepID=UPI002AFE7E8B|nr:MULTISPECIES: LacI family DNA-binding transcriptional regulator [unclassified Yoonia]
MPGIKALAERLNISIGTVSRALNDMPGVNAETRQRVLEMAHEMGYVANAAGRNLRKGRTNTIGLIIGTGPTALAGDNFYSEVVDEMQSVLLDDGIDLVVLPVHSAMDPIAFLRRTLMRGTLDGIILTATLTDDPRIAMMEEASMPYMTLGRSRTPGDYLWIDMDFEEGARQAVTRLAELGHRRIAVCVPQENVNFASIYEDSWRATMTALGLPATDDLCFADDGSEDGGARVAARLAALDDRPTAVLVCAEPMTSGVYGGLQAAGLRPGADVSVIAFRQSPLMRHLSPPISCFEMSIKQLGRDMADAIFALTYGSKTGTAPQSSLLPMTYIERPSVQALTD